MSEKGAFRVLCICLLVAAALLGFAIEAGKQPAEFYTALRWVCSITLLFAGSAFVYSAVELYLLNLRKKDPFGIAVPVIFNLVVATIAVSFAVLFNPIFPFHYGRSRWLFFDKLCIGVIAFLCFAIYHRLGLPVLKQVLKLCAGVFVAAWLIIYGVNVINVMTATAKTSGRVIDVEHDVEDSDTQGSVKIDTGVYEFEVGGKKFYGRSTDYDEIGDTVPVLYNPQNPSENRSEGDREPIVKYAVLLLFGGYFSYWAITSSCGELLKLRQRS